VVFNLSSWAEKQPPLADWLVEELNARYDVPRKVGQAWIDHDQVLPLLDGLDEVRQDARESCVEAINAYRQEHGMVGMVVCSRVTDYAALTAKLKLRGAIMVQPLTDEQIDSYLAQTGDQLVAVRTLLHEDAEMRELAETPLMLSIMSLAYQGMPPDALPEHVSLDVRRRHLFDTYVERMMKRRGGSKHYTPEQTRHWLSWLAGRMQEHGQTVFYLERIQPYWADHGWQRWVYKLLVGGIFGVIYWIIGGLELGLILAGITSVLISMRDINPLRRIRWSRKKSMRYWWKLLVIVLGCVLVGWLNTSSINSFIISLLIGLIFWVFFGMEIGFIVGAIGIVTFGWLDGLHAGLMSGFLMMLLQGLPDHEVQKTPQSEKSMWNLAGNVVILGSSVGLFIGLASNLVFDFFVSKSTNYEFVFTSGLKFGVIFAIVIGGEQVIRHYLLRIVLTAWQCTPLNLVPFLDHAAERIFLRKVGGGYIFVHRMLLEYFASLEEEQPRKNDTSDDRHT
jgi:hypothetical protein